MTAQVPDFAAVVARLEKVEQQNRRLRGAGIAVLVVAVAGLLMGQAMPRAQIVEAEKFVLKDGKGTPRATLAVSKDGPELTLYDENGKTRAWLKAVKDGPGLVLYDENGKGRATLGVLKDGPGLALRDENGEVRADLAVLKDGPGMFLFDENGKMIWKQR